MKPSFFLASLLPFQREDLQDRMATLRYTAEELKKRKGKTDFKRIEAMTDEEIEEAARNDPDNPPMKPEDAAKFRRPGKGPHGYKTHNE
jgi:hypothetical protein